MLDPDHTYVKPKGEKKKGDTVEFNKAFLDAGLIEEVETKPEPKAELETKPQPKKKAVRASGKGF